MTDEPSLSSLTDSICYHSPAPSRPNSFSFNRGLLLLGALWFYLRSSYLVSFLAYLVAYPLALGVYIRSVISPHVLCTGSSLMADQGRKVRIFMTFIMQITVKCLQVVYPHVDLSVLNSYTLCDLMMLSDWLTSRSLSLPRYLGRHFLYFQLMSIFASTLYSSVKSWSW